MNLSHTKMAIIALIIANVIWGAAPPIMKWALEDIQPFTMMFLRFFIASAVMLPFVIGKVRIKSSDIPKLFLIAFIGITIHIGFFIVGLQFSTSINVPIIASTGPIMLILGSVLFLHEKFKRKVLLGTMLSLLGVLVIIIRPIFEEGIDGNIVGNLFFVISTVSHVIYTVLLKKYNFPYHPLTFNFWLFVIGSFTFLPLFFMEMQTQGSSFAFTPQAWTGILYGAIFCSVIAYTFYTYAVKYLVASEVGIFVYVDPIITALVAVPLLGESITVSYLIGTALVFLGIFIAEGRLHWHPLHKLRNTSS